MCGLMVHSCPRKCFDIQECLVLSSKKGSVLVRNSSLDIQRIRNLTAYARVGAASDDQREIIEN